MHDDHPIAYDVVIAGAGPVGLFLACELRLAGISVLVLEQAEESLSPLKRPPFGMRGLSISTVEALYRRGLLNDITRERNSKSVDAPGQKPRRQAGHFAGIAFDERNIDTAKWPYRLPGPADLVMAADMEQIETVLGARASAMGVEIRRGAGVQSFDQSDGAVTIRAADQIVRGRWLVGCDGGRSTVRKTGGFEFVGADPEFTGYSVQVEMDDPSKLALGRIYTKAGMYFQSLPGTIAMVEFDRGAFHRSEPITRDHVQAVLRRISGIDVTLSALKMAATWTDRSYQATTYRRGRVFLAGDAAHIHSPLGGQGLNLGLGDAMNLGWKLAAAVQGNAPSDLLATYERERHPVGAQVLDWSRAQVALMQPSPHSRALEAIIRDLIATRDGATYFAERLWGVSLKYDLGSRHPLVGRSAPDFELADGTRLGEHLRGGAGVLLDFGAHAPLRTIAAGSRDRIAYVANTAKEPLGLDALLVRPDGFVAWASDGPTDLKEAAEAVLQWFGTL